MKFLFRTLDMVNSSMGSLVQSGQTLEDNLYCSKVDFVPIISYICDKIFIQLFSNHLINYFPITIFQSSLISVTISSFNYFAVWEKLPDLLYLWKYLHSTILQYEKSYQISNGAFSSVFCVRLRSSKKSLFAAKVKKHFWIIASFLPEKYWIINYHNLLKL